MYVNVLLYNSKNHPIGDTDFTFFIDDQQETVFQKASNNDSSYHYNQTIFYMTNLAHGQHELRMEIGHSKQISIAMLDSVVYTYVIPYTYLLMY